MSANSAKHTADTRLVEDIRDLKNQLSALRTQQIQGGNAIQIAYTDDNLLTWNTTPSPGDDGRGLIGTFVFTLEYDNPPAESVVFGDLDIQVNQGVDDDDHHLDFYQLGLQLTQINDGWLAKNYRDQLGYWPVIKILRLFTNTPSMSPVDFYIHSRWRYVGVGKTLLAATASTIIIPDGPTE